MTHQSELIEQDIEAYLEQHQNKELLRFVAVGSVDDGKSTLIGRLLHDTHGVYEDQLSAVKRASKQTDIEIDFSLFTDGLKAEREQGITIDVAYRYFSTENRKFIIADTPGHVQYTRNMATGASTANVAIILIDARLGVLQQSRRHAYIASLLGIPHLFVCINKMDLVDYDQRRFEEIREEFSLFARRLGFKDVTFIPISALRGHNVVHTSDQMPWYSEAGGKTLLAHLETVPIAEDRNLSDLRFPVQYVQRPNLDYRGLAGQIASGRIKRGDEIVVLPSLRTSRVKSIDTFDGTLDEAFAPMSVTLRLEDEVDVSRGDMLVHASERPKVAQNFEAMLVWMSEAPLDVGKSYFIKHTAQYVRAEVSEVLSHTDLETLEPTQASGLALNEIGRVRVKAHRPLFIDIYSQNRATGAFIVIDSVTNDTVAAGMIVDSGQTSAEGSSPGDGALDQGSQVSALERRQRLGHAALLIELPGDAATSKQLGFALERVLFDRNYLAVTVDGSQVGNAEAALFTLRPLLEVGAIVVWVGNLSSDTRSALQGYRSATPQMIGGEQPAAPSDDMDALAVRVVEQLTSSGALTA
ncbi:MAG: sulfate adenylyltransferase subunit CysN [Myxococcales bacterium]|nr:sulfate adenylyltransferase subunit CysN [Myxococcales bacterium]